MLTWFNVAIIALWLVLVRTTWRRSQKARVLLDEVRAMRDGLRHLSAEFDELHVAASDLMLSFREDMDERGCSIPGHHVRRVQEALAAIAKKKPDGTFP